MKRLIKRLISKKKVIITVLALAFTVFGVHSLISADTEDFYAGSLTDDLSKGSVIATFEFGEYPNRQVCSWLYEDAYDWYRENENLMSVDDYIAFTGCSSREEYTDWVKENLDSDEWKWELAIVNDDMYIWDDELYHTLSELAEGGELNDGDIVTLPSGDKYLREDYKDFNYSANQMEVQGTYFYKIEPITWQVLKVGKYSDGTDKVIAITRDCIDVHQYAHKYLDNLFWEGIDQYGNYGMDTLEEKQAYPSIRLFLNSYDISDMNGNAIDYYYRTSSRSNGKFTYSALTYTSKSSEEFEKQGFYEKAFNDDEKNAILVDVNEFNDSYVDGSATADKVRLLSAFETFDYYGGYYLNDPNVGHGSIYGFAKTDLATMFSSHRMAATTGYSDMQDYRGSYLDGKTYIPWWTRSVGVDGGQHFSVESSGSVFGDSSTDDYYGLRPVISIKLDYLTSSNVKLKLEAAIDDSYEFAGWKVNGVLDESLDDLTIENVSFIDLSKYQGTFRFINGYTTINDTKYTLYHQTDDEGDNHGYINFGSFPQSEITDENNHSLYTTIQSELTSDGMTKEIAGEKYLREDKDGTPHYFLFEPIKWRILNFDDDSKKLILLAENTLDARTWDTYSNETMFWNGLLYNYDFPTLYRESDGKKAYPSLRLYLNSYDSSLDSYEYDGSESKYSYSSLTVTDYSSQRTFREQGFLLKAFRPEERNLLIAETNEQYYEYDYDTNIIVSEPTADKVRFLSTFEGFSSYDDYYDPPQDFNINKRYGFDSSESSTGLGTNRVSFATDYSLMNYAQEDGFDLDFDYDYEGPMAYDDETSIPYWTMTVYDDGRPYGPVFIGSNGSGFESYNDKANNSFGVRPLITLNVTNLRAFSGDGSFSDPYTLTDKLVLRISSEDTNKGTVYTVEEVTDKGSYLEGLFNYGSMPNFKAVPNEGYEFAGWYNGTELWSEYATPNRALHASATLVAKFTKIGGEDPGDDPSPSGGKKKKTNKQQEEQKEEEKEITFKAFMNGYEDNTFRATSFVTREEVATIAARLLKSFNEDEDYKKFNTFIDTKDRWSASYLGFGKKENLIQGFEDNTFRPTSNITRAQLAVLASNFLDKLDDEELDSITKTNGSSNQTLSDVKNRWYESYVTRLLDKGILTGYDDVTFKGDNYATRIEIAIVFNKLTGRQNIDLTEDDINKATNKFTDIKEDDWFKENLARAVLDY